MRKKRRSFFELLFSLLVLGILAYLVVSYPPSYHFTLGNFQLSIVPLFFILVFAFIYFLFDVLFASRRRGFLLASFSAIYLSLRAAGLTHPFFLILLVVLFGGIEMFYVKKK